MKKMERLIGRRSSNPNDPFSELHNQCTPFEFVSNQATNIRLADGWNFGISAAHRLRCSFFVRIQQSSGGRCSADSDSRHSYLVMLCIAFDVGERGEGSHLNVLRSWDGMAATVYGKTAANRGSDDGRRIAF